MKKVSNLTVLTTPKLYDYELIDCGNGEKLERFGTVVLRRPDPQALWNKNLQKEVWENAHARYITEDGKGKWQVNKKLKESVDVSWNIKIESLIFELRLAMGRASFKHIGIFPEQYSNWIWIQETIERSRKKFETPSVLNLFGYTGGASIAALQAGAKVTHVDASPGSIEFAIKNTELSKVDDKPVRWIVDDARKFVEKEIRRGNHYHGIILDPPAYGHGPKNKVWSIEEHFLPLMEGVKQLLHSEPLFILLNGYSAGYSALAYRQNLSFLKEKFGGELEAGELSIEGHGEQQLPAGIFARWRS